jgi:hypothetical protein
MLFTTILGASLLLSSTAWGQKKSTNSTSTAQSIMALIVADGSFAYDETETWKFDEEEAATYFEETPTLDGAPTGKKNNSASSTRKQQLTFNSDTALPSIWWGYFTEDGDVLPNTNDQYDAPEGAAIPAAPTAPAAPAGDPRKMARVLSDNEDTFLYGGTLTGGAEYTMEVDATVSTDPEVLTKIWYKSNGPAADRGWWAEWTTLNYTYTYTYKYKIDPIEDTADVDARTAWDFVSSSTEDGAEVSVGGVVAGLSAQSTSRVTRKFSFSLLDSTGNNRVQDLLFEVLLSDGDEPLTSAITTSNVVMNTPGAEANTTSLADEVNIDEDDGSVDFFYTGTYVSGNASLLPAPEDARTILNSDNFLGNDDGGSTGSALALAVLEPVTLELPEGLYTIRLTGTVKGNEATATTDSFSITRNLKVKKLKRNNE